MPRVKRGKRERREGFHSAAGLIRYFDSEEKPALTIDPRAIVCACIGTAIAIEVIRYLYPF